MVLIVLYDWHRFTKFLGPIGISLGWGVLKKSEASSQRGFHPTPLKGCVRRSWVSHLEWRGRHESRGSECGTLSCGSSIEELADKLDVSFASLTCGCAREIMKLKLEVNMLVRTRETSPTHP